MTDRSRWELVLDLLKQEEWVSTAAICSPDVGGSEGTRRLRELRARGFAISKRKKVGSTQFEYHLIESAEEREDRIDTAILDAETKKYRGVSLRGVGTPLEPTPYARPVSGRHIADDSESRRAALGGSLPFVAWHGSSRTGYTAKHRGFSMSVKEWSSAVYWAVTRPDGTQASGKADTLVEAKRAALEIAL
jgi:hypothetical protein